MSFPTPSAKLNLLNPYPYDFLIYYSHISLGVVALLGVALALYAVKGGKWHRRGGRIYLIGMAIAAITSFITLFTSFLAPTVVNAITVIYAAGGAYLATRPVSDHVPKSEYALALLGLTTMIWFATIAIPNVVSGQLPVAAPLGVGGVLLILLAGDLNYLLRKQTYRKKHKIRRHLSRISWALIISVRAPVNELRDVIGISQVQVVFLPYLLFLVLLLVFGKSARKMDARAAR